MQLLNSTTNSTLEKNQAIEQNTFETLDDTTDMIQMKVKMKIMTLSCVKLDFLIAAKIVMKAAKMMKLCHT